ncbi:MAG TPA: hypothetical protein VKQ27_03355 [Acetobacteraceae bacterium]|nr:hypothetical protein [Acetobacteraceae bacterium]
MTQLGRAIIAIMTGRIPRIPNAEFAVIDTWMEEDEYQAGFPNQWNEAAGWRWWRPQ